MALIFLAIQLLVAFTIFGVMNKRSTVGFTAGVVGAIFALLIDCITVIGAGERGVQVTFGDVNPVALESGVHFVNPLSNIRELNVQLQSATLEKSSASTKDLQQVHTDIVTNFRLSESKVANIYKEYGVNVVDKVLTPSVNESFKAVTAKYTSEELVTKRDEVSGAILEHLRAKLAPYDISVDGVSLVNFGFSPEYQHAIEQKVIATQSKLKAEQDLARIQVEAQSRIAQADGEAKAIAIQAQAIQSSGGAQYVQLEWIKKWNGKMPDTMLGDPSRLMINTGK